MKAKVDEFRRGGLEVVQTLIDSWDDRLGHEHQNLVNKLNAEKEISMRAARLVDGQDLSLWKEIICDDKVERKVQKKKDELTARIEVMKNRGSW